MTAQKTSRAAGPQNLSDARQDAPLGGGTATVHLLGAGQVGQAFLESFPRRCRLVGVSDSTATCHDRGGLDPDELAAFKRAETSLASRPNAETLPTGLAVDLVSADIVVDATPSVPGGAAESAARGDAVLRRGGCLVLAAKDGLAAAGHRWFSGRGSRLGCNAVLGGTGAALQREIEELRQQCREVTLVGNASTTAVLLALESGASLEDGIRRAQRAGLLEPDPSLDLNGTDAAFKLAIVANALWADARGTVRVEDVACQPIEELDIELCRRQKADGLTTRLIARGSRDGKLEARYEALPRWSPFAAPPDRVAYGYLLEDGALRVHTGHGLGPKGTALALIEDVRRFAEAGS